MINSSTCPISKAELQNNLTQIKGSVIAWLLLHQVNNQPFGHFKSCSNAFVPDELDAATAGIELWVMLGLSITEIQRKDAIQHLKSYQNPRTGLVIDPTWQDRQIQKNQAIFDSGDTFFTMTTCEALKALDAHFDYPIIYLSTISPEELISRTNLEFSALHPFSIGDYATLIVENCILGIPGAVGEWIALLDLILSNQDNITGLWPKGKVAPPFTPAINRAFHFLRSTWNLIDFPYQFVNQIIDSCLDAAIDMNYYGQNEGDACNDLDLSLILYSSSCWTRYRSAEIKKWAACHLPSIFRIQKLDGGFSYKHNNAMYVHNSISISPGLPEGDIWGTVMYMGTIKMMAELAYPGICVPWKFSHIHRVPQKLNWIKKLYSQYKKTSSSVKICFANKI
jgi:hypothetical protein